MGNLCCKLFEMENTGILLFYDFCFDVIHLPSTKYKMELLKKRMPDHCNFIENHT